MSEASAQKKLKVDEEGVPLPLSSLNGFQVERVLNDGPMNHYVCLLGGFEDDVEGQQAIVKLSKRHFPLDRLPALLSGEGGEGGVALKLDFNNDIYGKYVAQGPAELNAFTVDVIYPCTAKHIAKHEAQKTAMIRESPAIYRAAVVPYINAIPAAHIQWVFNIIDGKSEMERVILQDCDAETGFTLLPDLKWDQAQVEQLYCVAIVRRRDVKSIRDLTSEHLPLLKNVLERSYVEIKNKFGVERSSLKAYLHYHPSYYHLHVHFTHTRLGSVGNGAGKAHLLADIIANIETFGSDFYQKATLEVEVGTGQELFKRLTAEAGSA